MTTVSFKKCPPLLVGAALALAMAVGGCDAFGLTSEPQANTLGERLGRDIAKAVHTEGRGECSAYVRDLWTCRVESDPGSGFAGEIILRLNPDGCWQARHTRYAKGKKWPYSPKDLSFGKSEAFGRTLMGCTDMGG